MLQRRRLRAHRTRRNWTPRCVAHVLGARVRGLQSHADEERGDAERAPSKTSSTGARAESPSPISWGTGSSGRCAWRLAGRCSYQGLRRASRRAGVEARRGPTLRALDLGTGAGAIALALGTSGRAGRMTATDVSEAALALARVNALALGTPQLEFLHGRLVRTLGGRIFDLIVSNPAYVAEDDPLLLQPPLSFEPRIALTPGVDALA